MTREEAKEALSVLKIYDNQWLREAIDMAIEALQGDMYCPNCGVRLVPENEYLEPTQTHGRLIDADALSEKLCKTTIFIKGGEKFQRMINDAPTIELDGDLISRQGEINAIENTDCELTTKDWDELTGALKSLPSAPDSRQRGEWIFEPKDAIELMFTLPKCSECGFESADGGNFCSNCGARMKGGAE